MTQDLPLFEDPLALAEKLSEILVSGPLYRKLFYRGENCHLINDRGAVGMPRYGQLPQHLKMFCDNDDCNALTWWIVNDSEVYFNNSREIRERKYVCRNCGKNEQFYQLIWQENRKQQVNCFVKVGQWPPLTIEVSPQLASALGADDSVLYRKGLIDFNFGHGIGAVAYFRRVLENKVNALLQLIIEAAQNAKVADEHLADIESAKKSHRVEDKIDIASRILPMHLKPGGHNPLDKLYKPLSAGLHGESDDECLTIFSEARFVFEYLFKNLTQSNDEARRYVKELSSFTKKA